MQMGRHMLGGMPPQAVYSASLDLGTPTAYGAASRMGLGTGIWVGLSKGTAPLELGDAHRLRRGWHLDKSCTTYHHLGLQHSLGLWYCVQSGSGALLSVYHFIDIHRFEMPALHAAGVHACSMRCTRGIKSHMQPICSQRP